MANIKISEFVTKSLNDLKNKTVYLLLAETDTDNYKLELNSFVDGLKFEGVTAGPGLSANTEGTILGINTTGKMGNIGSYNFAEGISTSALGIGSHAEGLSTFSPNMGSHSEGKNTYAIADAGHAEGESTSALGAAAHAEGQNTYSNSLASHAEGYYTSATAGYAHTEGSNTLASNIGAHAEGGNTIATGIQSHAEGNFTSAVGNYSHAEGNNTLSKGYYSHAEGSYTSANNSQTHAEGNKTYAGGENSHAEGENVSAYGYNSHAEGLNTVAIGIDSHTEGKSTSATGDYSHAQGTNSISKGNGSFVAGAGLIANYENETVLGQYNEAGTLKETLFVVGNGTSTDNRANALTLTQDGTLSATKIIAEQTPIKIYNETIETEELEIEVNPNIYSMIDYGELPNTLTKLIINLPEKDDRLYEVGIQFKVTSDSIICELVTADNSKLYYSNWPDTFIQDKVYQISIVNNCVSIGEFSEQE